MKGETDARRLRTAAVAGAASLLAIAGHSAVSAALPSFLPSVAIVIVATVASSACARRIRGAWGIAGLLVALQALAHVVLWATGHAAPHAAHYGTGTGLLPGWSMTAAHIAAALVAAGLIVRIDAIADSWVAMWQAALGVSVPCAIPPRDRVGLVFARPSATSDPCYIHYAVSRRGPPLLLALAITG